MILFVSVHPNVRLFITHGGPFGTQEAVYFGVPMAGIPFIFGQKLNIQNFVSKGVAVMLDYRHITLEGLMDAFIKLLYDPR
jgi:glucuronosyltransferase